MFRVMFFILLNCLIFQALASSPIRGDLLGHDFSWKNVIDSNVSGATGATSLQWNPVSSLPSAVTWVPGSLSTAHDDFVKIYYLGESVLFPVKMVGIEYFSEIQNPVVGDTVSSSVCHNVNSNGSVFSLIGDNCNFNNKIVNSREVNPFSYVRPVFNFDSTNVHQLFDGKPSGVYRGTSILNYFFYYYTSSGVLTRVFKSENIDFEIKYEANHLTSVTVIGDGVFSPRYSSGNYSVSGDVSFNIISHGFFNNGVKLSFVDRVKLFNLVLDKDSSFPYSINCVGCEDYDLVKDGVIIKQSTTVKGSGRQINFDLNLLFEDVDLTNLKSGYHYDSFSILFEAAM